MGSKARVLHIAKWYPHPGDPQNGSFVKNQIDAAGVDDRTIAFVNAHFSPITTENSVVYGAAKMNWSTKLGIFISELSQQTFDIVHFHCFTPDLLPMLWYAKSKGLKTAYTEHWSGYLKENQVKLSFVKKRSTLAFLSKIDKVLAISPQLEQGLKYIQPSIDTEVVPNIIGEINQMKSDEDGTSATKFVVVADVVFEIKRQDVILEVFKTLPRMQAELHFIGGGPDFDRLAAQAKYDTNVYLHGRKTHEEVLSMLPNYDVHVLFSAYETFGITTLEARKAGLWSILRKKFGASYLADNGCKYAETEEELAAEMGALLHAESPGRNDYAALGSEKIGNRIKELYQELIS